MNLYTIIRDYNLDFCIGPEAFAVRQLLDISTSMICLTLVLHKYSALEDDLEHTAGCYPGPADFQKSLEVANRYIDEFGF